ncbi:MAG TPA: ABC transporter substrate-binding protein [Candidatus Dormibacteraeota bacterium]|nr:ABC transporter substrate-binding protein [Candidatus Dormibacteraeota bacterium]
MIRRGLLALGVGVPLSALLTILVLVFRGVILSPEAPRPGGTYVEGVVGQVGSLNPLFGEATAGPNELDALLFEPLVRVLPTGTVQGELASRWEVSPDGRSYTFTVRPNARWSDGTPVSADDVVFTVRTVQDPQFPGALFSQSWKDIVATAVDAGHVRFALPGHNAGFLANLELLDIVPAHLLAGKAMAELASASPNLNPVGTGPFRMVTTQGDRIQLERNPFAWRRPWLEAVTIRSFPSQAAALDALDRGQIDGLANLTPSGAAQEQANTQVKVLASSTYQYAELIFNLKTDEPYFQDVRVRQAIAKAIDRTAIIRDVLGGQAVPDDSPIPRSITWAYDSAAQQPAFDPTAAAKLLDDAGWALVNGIRTKGTTSLSFGLMVSSDVPPYERVADKVASQLSQVGIVAEVRPVTTASLIHDYLNPRTFDMTLTAFDNGPDPDVYSFWHSSQSHPGGFNFAGMKKNVFIDGDLEDGRNTLDLTARAKAYATFQEDFAKEIPAVFLYSPRYVMAVNRRIHGVRLDSAIEPEERYAYVSDWYREVGR